MGCGSLAFPLPVVFQVAALLPALTHPSHLPKSKLLGMSKFVA